MLGFVTFSLLSAGVVAVSGGSGEGPPIRLLQFLLLVVVAAVVASVAWNLMRRYREGYAEGWEGDIYRRQHPLKRMRLVASALPLGFLALFWTVAVLRELSLSYYLYGSGISLVTAGLIILAWRWSQDYLGSLGWRW